jgi:hypothetical protein
MIGVLKTVNRWWCNLRILSSKLFITGQLPFFFFFFDKSVEFISKSAELKGAPPNYTKSITKSA